MKRHHLALRTGGPGQGTNAVDRRCQTWQDIDDERNDWSTWGSRRRWKAPNTRTARGGGPAPAYLHLKQGLGNGWKIESCENVRNVKKGTKLHLLTTDARQLMTIFWWKPTAVWWQFVKKTYRRSTTARSCVNKRDQREGEGDEQDHCYRPETKNIFFRGRISTFLWGLDFYGYTIKVC